MPLFAFAFPVIPTSQAYHPLPQATCPRVRASHDSVQQQHTNNPDATPSGVNINKYKSQRSTLSADKRDVTADEVNDLMIRAGKGVRPSTSAFRASRQPHPLLCSPRLVSCLLTLSLCHPTQQQSRDLTKWSKAIKGSFTTVSARLISNGQLVGFARATSDHALNGTIWDVVTDPKLPDEVG